MNKEKTVFLGGTCNGSMWRDKLIPLLKIKSFNPVVEDWTSDCMEEEVRQRAHCDFCLYVITPKMTGVYAIAEAVEDSIKRPHKTVFVVLNSDGDHVFTEAQLKSLNQVGRMIDQNGAIYLRDLDSVAEYLNRPELHLKDPLKKTLHNSDISGAKVNVKDIKVVGNGDMFKLLCKASSENEGWMKSTKALAVHDGCLVQVTTQQRNPDGSYAVAEALSYVPGVEIVDDVNNGRRLEKF